MAKDDIKCNKVNFSILKENDMLLVHNTRYNKLAKAPLPGFIASYKHLIQEASDLLRVHTSDGFDLNACKLMKKSSYDFSKPTPLRNVIKPRPYGLEDTQKR